MEENQTFEKGSFVLEEFVLREHLFLSELDVSHR